MYKYIIMKCSQIVEAEQQNTRWLIRINGQPVAHYPTKPEVIKAKQQLKRKFGTSVEITIEEIPANKYKIGETLDPNNELPGIPMVTTYMIYKRVANEWKPLIRFSTPEEAEDYYMSLKDNTVGRYKLKQIQYPKTQYE